MNKVGRQEQNNEAVFSLLSKATKLDDGGYVFTDLSNKIFLVDKLGDMYIISDNIVTPCNSGIVSSKSNGYIYVDITIEINGKIQSITYAQHSIVCALFNGVPDETNMVANHKDNCPWNNRPGNLEWTTQALNTLHGKVISALWRNRFYVNNMTHRVWTEVRHNQSVNDYECLLLPISVDDLTAYQQHIGKGLQSYWGLRNKEYISDRDLVAFITWLDNNRINNKRQIRNYNMSSVVKFDDNTSTKSNKVKSLTPEDEVEQFFKN